MVTQNSLEKHKALGNAIDLQIPLVVTSWSPDLFLNYLYAMDYETRDSSIRINDDEIFHKRLFSKKGVEDLELLSTEMESEDLQVLLLAFEEISQKEEQVVLIAYPSLMRALYLYAPDAMTLIGAESARVDLTVLFSYEETAPVTETSPNLGVYTVISPLPIDDYLSNPGIGWQYDVNPDSAYLPETVLYGERLQIGWSTLNPEEGIYNWEPLDRLLSGAISEGKQFSFRVFTMRGGEYGGHMLPEWVLSQGVQVFSNGSPDYSSCAYQNGWATFVEALIRRYDGNQEIAYIDISGYGDFNEWSWQDQSDWDGVWNEAYRDGFASSTPFSSLDGQARRRLVDIFIGGSFAQHQCRNAEGGTDLLSYDYEGFQNMQLVMPFAGINQSTQYVFMRNPEVGFRHDCLGRPNTASIPVTFEHELAEIWQKAPIVYEFCPPDQFSLESARWLLAESHGSLVHNNGYLYLQGGEKLEELLLNVGYRYLLKEMRIQQEVLAGENLPVEMDWQNIGLAPNYPAMGQDFLLTLFLEDGNGRAIDSFPIDIDISAWIPALSPRDETPTHSFSTEIPLPATLYSGSYILKVAIIEKRTGNPIQLAFEGNDGTGKYFLTQIEVK
ncbi:MAG: DUF4832 domain-containing protein [Anaerolineae bacterium]|jgi:hypothetical protein|nr:DUF4832 domain-containing protein [Anaerolineae bacterium]MBT7189226.1 DUF4832 domain-containing protein [Anaerolineae bacterium]